MPAVAKKKKRKMYFGQVTEDAIIKYNKETDPIVRNQIYNESIQAPFEKLAENIIHTFKFYYFDVPSEEVKHEVVSFLVMNMHKFKEGKGKAFSYFSIVAKNYLILHNLPLDYMLIMVLIGYQMHQITEALQNQRS